MTKADRPVRLAGVPIAPPSHVCVFYDSEADELASLMPFIRDGFDSGDKSFHIIDEERRERYLERLGAAGIDTVASRKSGQLEVRGWQDAHLRPGWFDQFAMLRLVNEVLSRAQAEGYGHTRWVANMGWALSGQPGVRDLVEYCARLNDVVPRFSATILCTYDLSRFTATQVVGVLRSHPHALMGGVLHTNPFYVEPAQLIDELKAARVVAAV
jgi:KaiC/GvpD/RAD55 family RecA-like ATPase